MANGMSQQMNRNVGGMPIMGQRIGNNAQLWMDNVGRFGEHSGGNRGSSANPGSAMFMTPPPPLGMMTNHRQLIGPPPPLPSIHPASSMQQSFAITSFSVPSNQVQQSTMGMGAMQINEDAMWQVYIRSFYILMTNQSRMSICFPRQGISAFAFLQT
jgi:hypothetical protein